MPDVPVGRWSLRHRRALRAAAVTCTFALTAAAPAAADTQILTGPSQSSVQSIFSPSGGHDDAIAVGDCLTGGEWRLLVKFDVAGNPLPPGATITSATVRTRYFAVNSSGGDPAEVGLHRQFTAWNSSATWLTPDGINEWVGGYPEYGYPEWPTSTAGGFIYWDVTNLGLGEDPGGYMISLPYGDGCVAVHGLTADYPPALIIEYDT
jgi:hypothetical protein